MSYESKVLLTIALLIYTGLLVGYTVLLPKIGYLLLSILCSMFIGGLGLLIGYFTGAIHGIVLTIEEVRKKKERDAA